jgi:rhodanese-related sulfurtransferase
MKPKSPCEFLVTLLAIAATSVASAGDTTVAMVSQDALLARQQKGDASLVVLDVRTPGEYVAGHVPGAVNIPHDQVAARLAEVPKDKDVVAYCRSGRRTGLALDVLAANGYTRLGHLEGDMLAWQEKQRPLEVPRDPAACAAALEAGRPATEACAAQ